MITEMDMTETNSPIQLTKEDKRKWWGDGPWVDEPDYLKFEHEGIVCQVIRLAVPEVKDRVFGGYLCGYVHLPEGHKWIDLNDDEIPAEVHGGITCKRGDIIGFDCAHSFDVVPSMQNLHLKVKNDMLKKFKKFKKLKRLIENSPAFKRTYRTWDFVIEETKRLAEQVKEAI